MLSLSFIERQSEDLNDSVIEKETFSKLTEETETEVNKSIPLQSTSKVNIYKRKQVLPRRK